MWWDSHLVVRINKEDLREMCCLHSIINRDRGSKPFSPWRWAQALETSRLDQLSQTVWWAKRHWIDQGEERTGGRAAQVRLSRTTTQHRLPPSPGTGCRHLRKARVLYLHSFEGLLSQICVTWQRFLNFLKSCSEKLYKKVNTKFQQCHLLAIKWQDTMI